MSDAVAQPFVSCVLSTADRPHFFAQAIRCFARQSCARTELVVIDSGRESVENLVPRETRYRYLRVPCDLPLGAKLNLGITHARGGIIQKLDDDDYYHPDFVARMSALVASGQPLRTIAALDRFLVLISTTGRVVYSGPGWFAGNSLCFHKALWEKMPFRPINVAEDWWFVQDHAPRQARMTQADLAIVVRHDAGHTWNEMGRFDVTAYFASRPEYQTPLASLVPAEDFRFYRSLRSSV